MIRVSVAGATGVVGQQFIRMLEGHKYFELVSVAASSKSAGNLFGAHMADRWVVSDKIPDYVKEFKIKDIKDELECDVVFSSLPSKVAGPLEIEYSKRGYKVFTNSSFHRMDPLVPLVIPEINPEAFSLLPKQQEEKGWSGALVASLNCTATGELLPIFPLHKYFGLKGLAMISAQARSGAGYKGLNDPRYTKNIFPFIAEEEEKLKEETRKVLRLPDLSISARCTRADVVNGHFETIFVTFDQKVSLEEIIKTWQKFKPLAGKGMPTAPDKPVIYTTDREHPQPISDINEGNGMSVVVGRLEADENFDYAFQTVSHNTIRGAAGGSILNAELAKVEGYL